MRTGTEWLVRLDGVSRSARTDAGEVTLLAPTTAELRSHTLTVVAGPSGSGKTTLCNVVIGWEQPDRGTVQWATGDAVGWARLAVAPQRLALIEALTLAENMALPFWSRRARRAGHAAAGAVRGAGDRPPALSPPLGGVVR